MNEKLERIITFYIKMIKINRNLCFLPMRASMNLAATDVAPFAE